jgi:hypothetical protein
MLEAIFNAYRLRGCPRLERPHLLPAPVRIYPVSRDGV